MLIVNLTNCLLVIQKKSLINRASKNLQYIYGMTFTILVGFNFTTTIHSATKLRQCISSRDPVDTSFSDVDLSVMVLILAPLLSSY